ncbi:MAG: hypothetical protein RIR94_1978, partial [Bacteroidota bacterium]
MTPIKSTELLAQETWPLFERKLRRVRFFQKVKKWFLWSASGALLLWILTMLLSSQPSEPKFELKKKTNLQVIEYNKTTTDKRAKLFTPNSALNQFPEYTPLQRTEIEGILPWQAIQTLTPTTAQSKKMVLTLRADLALACAQLNFQPQTWSLQANGHSLSALIDQQTLMIMNLMYGTETLPAYPTDMNTESWYRPEFFPADQFVHIAFYEVGDWIQ